MWLANEFEGRSPRGRRLNKTTRKPAYSTRIIKAGALLADTKLLLENWNEDEDIEANLDRVRRENLLGKPSRSRADDILAIFKQRYLGDPDILAALVVLAQKGAAPETLDRLLYFQAARSDHLLHDIVTELLFEMSSRLDRRVRPAEIQRWISAKSASGTTEKPWSEAVQTRVARGLLSTLRDFGVLEGSVNKNLAYPYLPSEAFAFTALQLHLGGSSARELLEHPEWRLFLVPEGTVERLFLEAHRDGLLEYHAAGSVVRIDFPAENLPEYARVLARR